MVTHSAYSPLSQCFSFAPGTSGGSDARPFTRGRLQIGHGVAEVLPGPVATGQRTHALDAVTLEEQRHPGAGGLVGSGAVEHDLAL